MCVQCHFKVLALPLVAVIDVVELEVEEDEFVIKLSSVKSTNPNSVQQDLHFAWKCVVLGDTALTSLYCGSRKPSGKYTPTVWTKWLV